MTNQPQITLLASSASIELVSSSARVTSAKFQKGVCREWLTPGPIDRTPETPGSGKNMIKKIKTPRHVASWPDGQHIPHFTIRNPQILRKDIGRDKHKYSLQLPNTLEQRRGKMFPLKSKSKSQSKLKTILVCDAEGCANDIYCAKYNAN